MFVGGHLVLCTDLNLDYFRICSTFTQPPPMSQPATVTLIAVISVLVISVLGTVAAVVASGPDHDTEEIDRSLDLCLLM